MKAYIINSFFPKQSNSQSTQKNLTPNKRHLVTHKYIISWTARYKEGKTRKILGIAPAHMLEERGRGQRVCIRQDLECAMRMCQYVQAWLGLSLALLLRFISKKGGKN